MIQPESSSTKGSTKNGGKQTIRPNVDPEKTIYAAKIFDIENFSDDSL